MQRINEISYDQISNLNASQLSELLLKLLHLEYKKYNFLAWNISVPLKINVSDGAEDGMIRCKDPKGSLWIQSQLTLFQCKAYNFYPSACESEILDKTQTELKPRIKSLFDSGGEYVIFMGHDLNGKQITERIDAIRAGIKKAKEPYYETAKIRILDSNLIKDWANEFLSTIIYIQACNKNLIPLGLKTWTEWDSYKHLTIFSFKKNEILSKVMEKIKIHVTNKEIVRIIGLSGLGKTRLLLECFRPPIVNKDGRWDFDQKKLSDSVVYFDVSNCNENTVLDFTKGYCCKYEAILIIDNCSLQLHLNLVKEINRKENLFSLITIDHDLKEDRELIPFETILLKREFYKDLVHKILKDEFRGKLDDNLIRQIGDYTEGFPQMAVLFAQACAGGIENLSGLLADDLMRKLIFGREEINEEEFRLIRACSIFTSFSFPSPEVYSLYNEKEIENLESESRLIQEELCKNISWDDFYRIIRKFEKKGIIERRGNRLMVKPMPLALKLAIQWWEGISPSNISSYFDFFIKTNNLATRVADRLYQLDNLDTAKQIVSKLWRPNSTFSQAEVLNSNMGSRLFRSIVTVNPDVALETLKFNYLGKSSDYLKTIRAGRRNLIWALEKLCFRKDTFEDAAHLMMLFAEAENEHYGNNATQQFKQLFRIMLPGTEVDLKKRLNVLKRGLSAKIIIYNKLIIEACNSALECSHFSSLSGAENQGSFQVLKHYQPRTWSEVWDYWEGILSILLDFALSDSSLSKDAESSIINHIRCLFHLKFPENKIESILVKLSTKSNFNWLEARNNLNLTLNHEMPSDSERAVIKRLLHKFAPTDLSELIYSTVSKPEWYSYDIGGKVKYKPEQKAKNLAKRFVEESIDIIDYLPILLKDEQRQAFAFGQEYSKLKDFDISIIENSLKVLNNTSPNSRNHSFLLGYISSINSKKLLDKIYSKILNQNSLFYISYDVINYINPNLKDVDRLIDKTTSSHIFRLECLERKTTVIKFNSKEIIHICTKIQLLEDIGKWISLGIISTYVNNIKNRFKECQEYIMSLIIENNYLINNSISQVKKYSWYELVRQLLLMEPFLDNFPKIIASQILESCNQQKYIGIDYSLSQIIDLLFEKHFEKTWEIFGDAFLSNEFHVFFNLKSIIADSGGLNSVPILFKYKKNIPALLSWAKINSPKAASRLINVSPLSVQNEEGDPIWHPFTKELIDEYGEFKDVLNQLSANMGTFMSSGSSVPLYSFRKKLCELLLGHPKSEVRLWAMNKVAYYKKTILSEKLNDEQWFLE